MMLLSHQRVGSAPTLIWPSDEQGLRLAGLTHVQGGNPRCRRY